MTEATTNSSSAPPPPPPPPKQSGDATEGSREGEEGKVRKGTAPAATKTGKVSAPANPITFCDISDAKLAHIIEQSVRFKLPEGGVHKPCVWYSHPKNWGVFYRVYAKIPAEQIKNKGWRNTLIHLKWNFRNGMLMPNKGYEEVEKIIDEDYTETLKEMGMKGS